MVNSAVTYGNLQHFIKSHLAFIIYLTKNKAKSGTQYYVMTIFPTRIILPKTLDIPDFS